MLATKVGTPGLVRLVSRIDTVTLTSGRTGASPTRYASDICRSLSTASYVVTLYSTVLPCTILESSKDISHALGVVLVQYYKYYCSISTNTVTSCTRRFEGVPRQLSPQRCRSAAPPLILRRSQPRRPANGPVRRPPPKPHDTRRPARRRAPAVRV